MKISIYEKKFDTLVIINFVPTSIIIPLIRLLRSLKKVFFLELFFGSTPENVDFVYNTPLLDFGLWIIQKCDFV